MIEINTTLGVKNFHPGDDVTGKVNWDLESGPKEVVVNLLWHTQGKGTEDNDRVDQIVISQHTKRGEANFSLKIPKTGPWSFSGKLISILWIVEVVTNPTTEKMEVEIIVGPEAREIVINEA